MGTGTFGMNHSLGDAFSVEMRQFLDKMNVL
jgi:hypothetical protein